MTLLTTPSIGALEKSPRVSEAEHMSTVGTNTSRTDCTYAASIALEH